MWNLRSAEFHAEDHSQASKLISAFQSLLSEYRNTVFAVGPYTQGRTTNDMSVRMSVLHPEAFRSLPGARFDSGRVLKSVFGPLPQIKG